MLVLCSVSKLKIKVVNKSMLFQLRFVGVLMVIRNTIVSLDK